MLSWQTVKFSTICDVLSGFAFKSKLFGDTGLPIVRIRDVKRGLSKTFYNGEFDKKFILSNGDMLIGMDGDFNLAKWKGGKALLNQRVCKITPHVDKVDPNFLFYFLPLALMEIWNATPFVTVKHLSAKSINDIDVPLPPLSIQKKIAAVLEKADTLRGQCQQMEKELNTLSQSVFLDMFGDPVTNPKGWVTSNLEEQLEFLTSGSRGWAKHYDNNGHDIFIRIQNVLKDKMNLDDIQKISAPASQESKRTKVQDGDVLLSITADLGRAGVVRNLKCNSYISQHLALIRVKKDKIIPEFLSALLVSPAGLNQFEQKNKGGTKAGLNFTDIRTLKISIPPIELQDKFKLIKQDIDTQLVEIKTVIETHNNFFNSLMQRAFKGELALRKTKDVA